LILAIDPSLLLGGSSGGRLAPLPLGQRLLGPAKQKRGVRFYISYYKGSWQSWALSNPE
jgi:hypothetical protein